MKEFIYFDKNGLDIPLSDEIFVIENCSDEECIVSNTDELKAQLVAPEIDFYLKNSQDSILQKAKNVSILYEVRANVFDLAKDTDYMQEVGKNILIIGSKTQDISDALKAEGFGVLEFTHDEIESVSGHLGSLHVSLNHDGKSFEVTTNQILWENAPKLERSGILEILGLSVDEILKIVLEKIGNYTYKNFIFYDKSICQYHERREEICGKCAEVCPTVSILKEDENKHLKFSHIDCHGCGGCVSVCPSGALDYSQMPLNAFYEISKMYEDKIPLIIPRKMFDEGIDISLPQNILPFAIEGEKYLHESHFLSLLQQSGSQIAFYTDFLSKGSRDSIDIINQIYRAKYGVDGILVCMNKSQLEENLQNITLIENSKHDMFSGNLSKREVFAKRLSWIVKEENLGIVKSGEHVRYGDVKVNEDICTLCLSCVDACNVGALSANADDNTLRLNPSVCTTCGYCEVTCPEKDCMEVVRGEIPLEKSWFSKRILAKDTLFECIVCKKPYATTKSVLKIANMMKPIFKNDELKIKSLYCCADCKPKVIFDNYIQNK